jgi:type II secretion system protein G
MNILPRRVRGAFTLVELLVVIAIIGLLSTVAVVSLNTSRVKARDTKRAADLKQIMTALELYQSDNGHYPITTPAWACFDCASYINTAVINPAAASITVALAPYLPKAPTDPFGFNGSDAGYLYISGDGVSFKLFSWRRPEDMRNYGAPFIDPSRCGTVLANGQCSSGNNSAAIWGGPTGSSL